MSESNEPTNDRYLGAYAGFLFRWRWLALIAALAFAGVVTSGVRFTQLQDDPDYFFREDNPQLLALQALRDVYTKTDNTLIVVAPDSGDVFQSTTLEILGEMTERGWKLPFAARVDSVTNFQHTRAKGDELLVGDLVDPEKTLGTDELAELRRIALNEPLLKGRLISEDASVAAINVRHILPRKKADEATHVTLAVRELAAEIEARHPDHSVYLTGSVLVSNAFAEATLQDVQGLIPLMFFLILLITFLALRSFWAMLITLIIIGLSSSSAMGVAGWLGIPITAPSSAAPTVIMTLAVADSVHLLVTLLQSMHDGRSKTEAMSASLRTNGAPVFLTSLTTVVGLLALNLSEVRPFNDFGNIAAIGVALAYLYVMLLLPLLVYVCPLRTRGKRPPLGSTGGAIAADFVIRRRKALLWLGALAVLGLSAMITRNEPNDAVVEYFDETFAFRTDTDFIEERLSGIDTMEFSLSAGEADGISDPDFLARVDAFAAWLREQPEVAHVSALSDILKRLNQNMHGDDPSWHRLPEDRALAAQYLLLYEMSLPYGLDLNDTVSVDKSATRVVVTTDNINVKQIRDLKARSEAWLREHTPEPMWAVPSSIAVMFAHISERNIRSSAVGFLAAVFAIAGILMLAFRSVRLGLISMVPNLVPALLALGLWGLFVGTITVAHAVATTAVLGIVVDDTVHFLSKYSRARREGGMSPEQSVRYAFSTVGSALVVTSLVLVAGFLVLTVSHCRLNSYLGLMAAIVIVVALAADLLLLPPLLMTIDRSPWLRDGKGDAPPASAAAERGGHGLTACS